ncbi:centrosome-associated protein Alms1a-like isoform X2 [Eurosta solidaginis]|uniref:centrosome-associated protein Alms1a-like isoform X2 n=1 Tax=Eurosta solidaginis TaxID=178769 RepID=UPI003530DA1E
MRKRTHLPRTSRVNEKIREYYMKFGQDRDLEKYMRLYSPCGQRSDCRNLSSATSIGNCQSEEEGRAFRRLFQHEIEVTTESDTDLKEFNVPIKRQTEMSATAMKAKGDECTSSAPDLHTPPPKTQRSTDSKQTQTPESITKSHRRLEWDSLGDVGYRKSLSTSNISILERSVLKEYFQEISTKSDSKQEKGVVNSNDKKVKKNTEQPKAANNVKNNIKEVPVNHNTPPLASSTMMSKDCGKENIPSGSRPKLISRSTSMSLQKRYDQGAQTSIQRMPQLRSREVQVTLSSTSTTTPVTSSNAADTATPSSFDYYSSRSTNSTADGEVGVKKLASFKGPINLIKSKAHQNQVHPYVAGINEMLKSRKVIDSGRIAKTASLQHLHDTIQHVVNDNKENSSSTLKGDSMKIDKTKSLQQIHDTLQQVLNDNKESSTSTSTMLNSPQLDLGIQLLCSLIDARSLGQKQKQKLVRDIVKRITTLKTKADAVNREYEVPSYNDNKSVTLRDQPRVESQNAEVSVRTTSTVKMARTAKTALDMSDLARHLPSSTSSGSIEQIMHVDVFQKPSPPTTSAKAIAKLTDEKAKKLQNISKKQMTRAGTLEKPKEELKRTNIADANFKKNFEKTPGNDPSKLGYNSDKDSSASKASTTSKEVTTQKTLINQENVGSSDTASDIAAHATMREWLNPMTQSEIEYEQNKLELERNSDKIKKCIDGENFDTERKTQLKWIQAEIQRLEILRCLLLKTNTESASKANINHKTDTDENAHENYNLYDTVFTDPKRRSTSTTTTTIPSAHSCCGDENDDKPLHEIEVIIEESNEDIIELDERIKRSKQRKRETQIVYDKPNDAENVYDNLAAGRARFRTMTEIVTTNEEQILQQETTANTSPLTPLPASSPKQLPKDIQPQQQQQRSKVDTPSTDSNDCAESVGSFAKQRKREFLEHYRHKKRLHYESLLHQQQQLLIQQQQHIIQELQQRCERTTHQNNAPAAPEHYSVPFNMHNTALCGCARQEQQSYQQTYFEQPCYGMRAPETHMQRAAPPIQPHARPCAPYPQYQQRIPKSHTVAATSNNAHKTKTIHSEQSTSSIFCISSEVSIPMGSSSTTTSSTTTTTTHQYDDVAAVCEAATRTAGVGVQTGTSLRRTQPIFGRRVLYSTQRRNVPNLATYNPQPISSGQSISVQVKPKAIAYVIQFDKKKTTSTTTITTTTTTTSNTTLMKIDNGEDIDDMRDAPCALQDYLERAKPQFVAQTKERKAILNQIQALRLERGKELRDIIENASENSMDTRLRRLPPPATKRLRIFATKEMKAMTQRHFENLPEVVEQQERAREERRRHGNRIIRDIFNQAYRTPTSAS